MALGVKGIEVMRLPLWVKGNPLPSTCSCRLKSQEQKDLDLRIFID